MSKTSSHRPRSRSSASTAARTASVPAPACDASQRSAQGGELVADQPGLLGVDPPGQVIGSGEPVRVLDRQLGLAHPAHPVQRLHHRLVPGQQPLPHRHQQPVPAGEPRIAGRDVPHPRHAARQPRTRPPSLPRPPACPGPGTPARRPAAAAPPPPPAAPAAPASASTPNRSQNTSGRSTAGTCAAGTSSTRTGTRRPRHAPGTCSAAAVHSSVVYRDRSKYAAENNATTRSQRSSASLIAVHEVPARRPVPHIQLDGVPGLGQLPGHPLRPRPVSTRMTDEEINPIPAHAPSIPPNLDHWAISWPTTPVTNGLPRALTDRPPSRSGPVTARTA